MPQSSSLLFEVSDYGRNGWAAGSDVNARAHQYCAELERGQILFFAQLPFNFPKEDVEYLISRAYSGSKLHKNVSYRPAKQMLRGFSGSREEEARVHGILRNYSAAVTKFVESCLTPYSGKLKLDFASFRPIEEEGRDLPLHKRNDLVHVDAFPSRPTAGARILRAFTNIHPTKSRIWITGGEFRRLAERYAADAGLESFASARSGLRRVLSGLGIPLTCRSRYDEFMLRFHDFLKENSEFQEGEKQRIEFPPMSTWLVYTDGVSHAAISGQFALEQTFIVPQDALVSIEDAPIRVLESMCGRPLAA